MSEPKGRGVWRIAYRENPSDPFRFMRPKYTFRSDAEQAAATLRRLVGHLHLEVCFEPAIEAT